MSERKIIVDESEIAYDGLFDIKEVYALIDDFLKQKNYDKFEKANREYVGSTGKEIYYVITPIFAISDFARKFLKIDLSAKEVKEVEVEIDGVKRRMQQGKLRILLSGILETDYEGRWEQTAFYYFIRTVFNKYVYRKHTEDFEGQIKNDVMMLREQLGALLNLYRYKKSS
ncbi:hypothetical protein HZB03_05285 [Candidatus Woesearchaeota archaeon]|nr:hypothetical protein [Candidatus Woesearchaeota archaeon]